MRPGGLLDDRLAIGDEVGAWGRQAPAGALTMLGLVLASGGCAPATSVRVCDISSRDLERRCSAGDTQRACLVVTYRHFVDEPLRRLEARIDDVLVFARHETPSMFGRPTPVTIAPDEPVLVFEGWVVPGRHRVSFHAVLATGEGRLVEMRGVHEVLLERSHGVLLQAIGRERSGSHGDAGDDVVEFCAARLRSAARDLPRARGAVVTARHPTARAR